MPIFTAAATAIVTALGATVTAAGAVAIAGSTALGTLAVSAVAAGLAVGTARLLSPKLSNSSFRAGTQAQNDPGVRIQMPPATDNKIPVFYGNVVTSGIITHANISNDNQTMTYVMVLSEQAQIANTQYIVNNIYRNDELLTIDNDGYVTLGTDADGNTDSNISGKIRVHVYAGNANSNVNQVYPVTNKVAANTVAPVLSTDGASMANLVYAVVSMNYDAGNNLVGLGTISFDIANNLYNPYFALYDYLSNPVYGAGLTPGTDFDIPSLVEVYDYASEQVDYTPWDDTDQPQDRWRIDGILSTYQPVKRNIDALCQSCATWFTYSPKLGKFKFVPNRAATVAEKANAFVFNDHNIISAFDITSTELYSLYNIIEAEHPQYNQKDQTDVVHISIPSGARNPNEPDNKLVVRYDLVNDNSRVKNLANIDLRQGRYGTVVSFIADYSALQCEAGDIVKLTNSVYDYNDDLFRVIRVDEQEGVDGSLTTKVVLLEYNDAIYDHEIVLQKAPPLPNGIPSSKNNSDIIILRDQTIANSAVNGFANAVLTARMIDIPDLVSQTYFTNLEADIIDIQNDVGNIQLEIIDIEAEVANISAGNIDLSAYFPVTETNIANDSITTPKIVTNAIIADKIAANAITTNKIQSAAIVADKLAANSVIAGKIGALAVTAGTIGANAVIAGTIGANAITAGTIAANAITGNEILANSVTGNRITTGTLTVSALTSGSSANNSGQVFGLGSGLTVVGETGVIVGLSFQSNVWGAVIGSVDHDALGVGSAELGGYAVAAYGGMDTDFTDWQFAGTLGFMNAGNTDGAGGFFTKAGGNISAVLVNNTYAGEFNGDVYCSGSYLPFTGSHQAIIASNTAATPGDILVDTILIAKAGLSETATIVDLSNAAAQKGVIGVYLGDSGEGQYPIPMLDTTLDTSGAVPRPITSLKAEYSNLMTDHKTININALGEGQINVCGENGNIEIGDLIVTSSIPGKGMLQSDDIVRNITVAKARETATFNNASEVKQIACIYLAG